MRTVSAIRGDAAAAAAVARFAVPALIAGLILSAGAGEIRCALQTGASPDTLVFPNEVFVITREELVEQNINSLDDLLDLLPGVVYWRAGPNGSTSGFSVNGRGGTGVTLLVNGEPFCDPYTLESLGRFVPFSRLERVEVIYSDSPLLTGDLSSNGAINLVIAEGGFEGPVTKVDFTYGRGNRRARRAWFSTPAYYISAALAYDEYLQDAAVVYTPDRSVKLGQYDGRSVVSDVSLSTDEGNEVMIRFHSYEDTYVGTVTSPTEDVRRDGFESSIRYRRDAFTARLSQRTFKLSSLSGRRSALILRGSSNWSGSMGALEFRSFVMGERLSFENAQRIFVDSLGVTRIVDFDTEVYRVEGGVFVGGAGRGAVTWRAGLFGGSHNVAGGYLGGEAGVYRSFGNLFSQSIMVSRRFRVPTAFELFSDEVAAAGASGAACDPQGAPLVPEVTDEVSLGTGLFGRVSIECFTRRENSRIIRTAGGQLLAEGTGTVVGSRGRIRMDGSILGFECVYLVGVEYFGKRSRWTDAIPRYRLLGSAVIGRPIFKKTERITMRWDIRAVGKRSWEGFTLGSYLVNDLSVSLTILGDATFRFQMKNLFDAGYETVPGFRMPERHYRIGIAWNLFD